MYMRKFLYFLLATLPAATGMAVENYSCSILSSERGFPSKVNTILIEEMGFAWLGADDGLYVITGNNNISRYVVNDEFSNEFNNKSVNKVVADDRGIIWALGDHGFVGYLPSYNGGKTGGKAIKGLDGKTKVYSVVPDGDDVYFGGLNRIWKYSHVSKQFSFVTDLDSDEQFKIDEMFLTHNSQLGKSLLLFSKGGKHMMSYNIESGNIRVDFIPREEGEYLTAFLDSEETLWISDFNKGVTRYANDASMLGHYDMSNSAMTSNTVLCFTEKDGMIWMGTDGGGIDILNPFNGNMEVLTYDSARPRHFPATTVTNMTCDHNGHIWCGRPLGGVFIISDARIESVMSDDLSGIVPPEGFTVFYQDKNSSDIWMGTHGGGLVKYHPESNSFERFPDTESLYVYGIARLNDGLLLLSCPNKGFFVFKERDGSIERSSVITDIPNYQNTEMDGTSIANDSKGNVLIVSDGIRRWNGEQKLFEVFPFDKDSIEGTLKIVSNSDCKYLTDDRRVYEWDESKPGKITPVAECPEGMHINCATLCSDGTVWMAVNHRTFLFDTKTGVTRFGAHTYESTPSTLLSDNHNKLWVGTYNALYVIDRENNSVMSLGEIDGAQNNDYVHQASLVANDGSIYLGGKNGFVRIQPDFFMPKTKSPEVVIYQVLLDGVIQDGTDNIVVPYYHSTLDIKYFARNKDITRMTLFRIFVEGPNFTFEEETDNPALHFERLSPGHYTMTISCSGQDLLAARTQELFTFDVKRPLFFQWWFLTLLVTTIFASLLLFMRYQNAKQRKKSELEHLHEVERYNFLINVAHELRTPLTLIIGPLNRILKNPGLGDEFKPPIKRVCQQANRMTTLLNTVLSTDKLQQGATRVIPAPVELGLWLNSMIDEFRDEASNYDMNLFLRHDQNISRVMMDEHLCHIVFANIMSNAIKHNETGRHITVFSDLIEDGKWVRISVRDHGSGIGETHVDKLFERYYRATEEVTGFGIGLSYAKTIVEAHGGRIGAYNNTGMKGATFYFDLPAMEEDRKAAKKAAINEPAADEVPGETSDTEVETKDIGQKVVLYVDDNVDLRDYVKEELQPYCKQVVTAFNGRDALGKLEEFRIDVVVTDVMMPEMNGLELCTRIKSSVQFSHIPVIMLTARADEDSIAKGYAAKADFYMPKPFSIERLIEIINSKI